jgi:two-component system phosphate regulon response regulator OmpR
MTENKTKILVVDDDARLRDLLHRYLTDQGFSVRAVADGNDMNRQLARERYDLMVLDLMLPGEDGLSICRRLRGGDESMPIIMLTAKGDDVDRIVGLEVGADDYLPKPFNPRELVARVKSILRRVTPERRQIESKQLRHGELTIDAGRREVKVGDQEIQLAPKEFDLLWELLDHRGLVLTRDQLLERVWGYTFAGDTRTVDVHVRQLRRKLGDASPIVTVWGVGYKVTQAKSADPAPA